MANIRTVLQTLDVAHNSDGDVQKHTMTYCKLNGELRTAIVTKNSFPKKGKGGQVTYSLKEKNVLLLADYTNNRTIAVKIPLIMYFNNEPVQH